jgi:hypothetical protein
MRPGRAAWAGGGDRTRGQALGNRVSLEHRTQRPVMTKEVRENHERDD